MVTASHMKGTGFRENVMFKVSGKAAEERGRQKRKVITYECVSPLRKRLHWAAKILERKKYSISLKGQLFCLSLQDGPRDLAFPRVVYLPLAKRLTTLTGLIME